jgi:hypothetical protein
MTIGTINPSTIELQSVGSVAAEMSESYASGPKRIYTSGSGVVRLDERKLRYILSSSLVQRGRDTDTNFGATNLAFQETVSKDHDVVGCSRYQSKVHHWTDVRKVVARR